jgi:hypothetical protein
MFSPFAALYSFWQHKKLYILVIVEPQKFFFFLEYAGELCIIALRRKKGEYKIQKQTPPTTPLPKKKLVTNVPITEICL